MLRRSLTAALPRLSAAAPRSFAGRTPRNVHRNIHRLPYGTPIASGRHLSTSSATRTTCPQCSSPLPTPLPVCTKCSYISDIPKEMSYHEMLGTPYEPNPFVVNNLELKRNFRDLQSVIHPDRWVGKSPEQQEAAAVMSARINDGLHRLSDPLRRVEYILDREGFGGEETDKLEDPELLMEILEMREQVEGAESREEVEQVQAQNTEKLEETIEEIERLVGAKDWPAVKVAAVKLKYLQGIKHAAAAWPNVFSDH